MASHRAIASYCNVSIQHCIRIIFIRQEYFSDKLYHGVLLSCSYAAIQLLYSREVAFKVLARYHVQHMSIHALLRFMKMYSQLAKKSAILVRTYIVM